MLKRIDNDAVNIENISSIRMGSGNCFTIYTNDGQKIIKGYATAEECKKAFDAVTAEPDQTSACENAVVKLKNSSALTIDNPSEGMHVFVTIASLKDTKKIVGKTPNELSAIIGAELAVGDVVEMIFDGSQWLVQKSVFAVIA